MKFCEACGAPLKEEAVFCENCGTPVSLAASQENDENEVLSKNDSPQMSGNEIPTYEEQPVERIRPPEESNHLNQVENTPSPKKSGGLLAALGLLAIIGIGGFLWWQNQESDQATVATAESSSMPVASTSTTQTEETTASTTVESTTESTVEPPTDSFDTTEAAAITQAAFIGVAGNFGVVLSPTEAGELAYTQQENRPVRAASVIKLFIMAAIYDQVDHGQLTLSQEYLLSSEDVVGGTGVLQNYPEGHVLSINQLLYHMIVDSDNTAGNVLVQYLGGLSGMDVYLREEGFSGTSMNRFFLDTAALNAGRDNYTTASDVAQLLQNIYQYQQVSPIYDQAMLDLLQQNKNRSKLPAQIGSEVVVYNKTGEYADYGVENDACIFEKNGEAYVVVVLSDDGKSSEQISAMNQLGKAFYETYMRSE